MGGNPALFLRSRRQQLHPSNDKQQIDIEVKNYLEKIEKENEIITNNTEDNNDLIIKNEINKKDNDVKNNNISSKSQKNITEKEKKKKIKQKGTNKSDDIDDIKKFIDHEFHEYENINDNCDIISNILNKDKANISIKSENLIKEKINKSLTNEYEMKKPIIKHQRSKSSIASSLETNTLISNCTGYLKVPTKYNNNKKYISNDSIFGSNNNDDNNLFISKKNPIIKPRLLHRRSSTTESNLNSNNYSNSPEKSPLSTDIFLALKNNSIINSISLSKKLNKIDFPTQKSSKINDLEKQNKKNIYVRKLKIKSHTFNTSCDLNDLTLINNKKDNILIPHPPLEPIPTQCNNHRPISVPIIRRRMYSKK